MLRHLTREADHALQSPTIQDLYALFNYPPFIRLQTMETNDALIFYMLIYRYVNDTFSRFSPTERLGIVHTILTSPDTREGFVHLFKKSQCSNNKSITNTSNLDSITEHIK